MCNINIINYIYINHLTKKITQLLFISCLLIICSCQEDEHTHDESSHLEYGIKEKRITLNDLDALPDAKIIFDKIKDAGKAENSTGRGIYNKLFDFFIDTSDILMIENGNYHSLTFPIYRLENDPNYLENLVLIQQDDRSYTAAIYKYELTPRNREDLLAGRQTIPAYRSRTILPGFDTSTLTNRIVEVFYTDYIVIPCSSGEHHAGNMGSWGSCKVIPPQILIVTRSVLIDIRDAPAPVGGELGSGGGGGGGGSTYNPNIPPLDPADIGLVRGNITKPLLRPTAEQNFFNGLNANQRLVMQQQESLRNKLLHYLSLNPGTSSQSYSSQAIDVAEELLQYVYDTGDVNFGLWAADFVVQNPDTTFAQLENWFMGVSEGYDGNYNAAYWENPNLVFPQQSLPSWINFKNAYPSKNNSLYDTASKMYNLVGGQPLAIYNSSQNSNTCALRVSRALNYSGITIPNIPGKTFKGSDNKYYFLGAANLLAWMKKTFGTPSGSNHLVPSQSGVNGAGFTTALENKKGIYIMIPINPNGCIDGSGFCATGHADMLENQTCDNFCNLNPPGGVKDIYIFELN